MAPSRISQLADIISTSIAQMQRLFEVQGAALPSFEEDAPAMPIDVSEARNAVLDATAELHDLLTDPLQMIRQFSNSSKAACLHTVVRFGIASSIPPGGTVSFRDISKQTALGEQMVGRIIRFAATMRVFCVREPDMVAHTRASRLLARPDVADWARCGIEELGPAGGKLADALEQWPGSQEPNETGFSLANDMNSIYNVLATHPDRALRFANAMKVMTSNPGFDLSYVTDYYDWASLGKAHVVDVGGSRGHLAMALAHKHSELHVTVQDMASVVHDSDAGRLHQRVRFMAHDMFQRQTISAHVFLFRWIFHNWSDEHCMRILRAQVPAFKPNARLIIQELLMPEPGSMPAFQERVLRSIDIDMGFIFNGRERTLADWKALVREAHPALKLKSVIQPRGSALGMLEFVCDSELSN